VKNKTKILTFTIMAIVLVIGTFQLSYAQENKAIKNQKMIHQKENREQEMLNMKNLAESLNLSAEQITELKRINLGLEKDLLELKKNIQLSHLGIKELLLDKELNLEEIKLEWQKIADLEVELKLMNLEAMMAAKKILTPEQQERLSKENFYRMFCLKKLHLLPEFPRKYR